MSCDDIKEKFMFIDEVLAALPGFSCIKFLGSGSYGNTYLIKDKSGKSLVIKAILPEKTDRSTVMREGDVLKRLSKTCSSNNILCHNKVLDYTKDGKRGVFFISEYVDGCDMFDYYYTNFKKRGIEKITYGIASQLLNAIEYIHSNRVVHLDIKPENVIISEGGGLRLIDFGGSFYYKGTGMVTHRTITPEYVDKVDVKKRISFNTAIYRDYYAFFRTMRHMDDSVISPMDVVLKEVKTSKKFKKLYDLLDITGIDIRSYKRRVSDIRKLLL